MVSKVRFFRLTGTNEFVALQVEDHAGEGVAGLDGHRVCAILSSLMGLVETAAEANAAMFHLDVENPENDSNADIPSRMASWNIESDFMSKLCESLFTVISSIAAQYPLLVSVEIVPIERHGVIVEVACNLPQKGCRCKHENIPRS